MNGSTDSGGGSRDDSPTLARVTYLPGVVPPNVDETISASPAGDGAARVKTEESVELVRKRHAKLLEEHQRASEAAAADAEDAPETAGERSARAHNISMHALTRRGVSSAEMTDLLLRRDLDANDVELEVTKLQQVGLLNDSELADTLVRTLRDRKGLGQSAITAELRRRKIDAEAISLALEAAADEDGDDELSRATEVAQKRAPQLRSLDAETARRRLGAFLMRKGYSGSVVSTAVATALSGANGPTSRGPRFQ